MKMEWTLTAPMIEQRKEIKRERERYVQQNESFQLNFKRGARENLCIPQEQQCAASSKPDVHAHHHNEADDGAPQRHLRVRPERKCEWRNGPSLVTDTTQPTHSLYLARTRKTLYTIQTHKQKCTKNILVLQNA